MLADDGLYVVMRLNSRYDGAAAFVKAMLLRTGLKRCLPGVSKEKRLTRKRFMPLPRIRPKNLARVSRNWWIGVGNLLTQKGRAA